MSVFVVAINNHMFDVVLSPGTIEAIQVVLAVILGMVVKDMATNLVSGLMFYFDKSFMEGDTVYVDGQKAIIVRVGMRKTVFGINNGRGYTWRYVQNSRIPYLHLEKVVVAKEIENRFPDIEERLSNLEREFHGGPNAEAKSVETK